jgi:hypothetical protein
MILDMITKFIWEREADLTPYKNKTKKVTLRLIKTRNK